jgi:hypothetical protein
LSIVCEPCGRHETYSVARLMERHGDAKMTDLLQTLANCPKARSAGWTKRLGLLAFQPPWAGRAKSAYRGLGKGTA